MSDLATRRSRLLSYEAYSSLFDSQPLKEKHFEHPKCLTVVLNGSQKLDLKEYTDSFSPLKQSVTGELTPCFNSRVQVDTKPATQASSQETEIETLRARVAEQDRLIQTLTEQNESLRTAHNIIKEQLQQALKTQDGLRQQLLNIEEQLIDNKAQAKKCQIQNRNLVQRHKNQVNQVQAELAALQMQLQDAQVKYALLAKQKQADYVAKCTQLKQAVNCQDALRDQIAALSSQAHVQKQQIDKQHQLIVQYEKKLQELHNILQSKTTELESAHRQLQRALLKISILQSEKQELQETGIYREKKFCKVNQSKIVHTEQQVQSNTMPVRDNRTSLVPAKTMLRSTSQNRLRRANQNLKQEFGRLKKEVQNLNVSAKNIIQTFSLSLKDLIVHLASNVGRQTQPAPSRKSEDIEFMKKEIIKLKMDMLQIRLNPLKQSCDATGILQQKENTVSFKNYETYQDNQVPVPLNTPTLGNSHRPNMQLQPLLQPDRNRSKTGASIMATAFSKSSEKPPSTYNSSQSAARKTTFTKELKKDKYPNSSAFNSALYTSFMKQRLKN